MGRRRIALFTVMGVLSALMVGLFAGPLFANHGDRVRMRDDCDPTTFNATFGNGTDICQGKGKTTASEFLGELGATQTVKKWRFDPSSLKLKDGVPQIELENDGGETHTFTMVDKFGGGFVPALNAASGHPDPAPECVSPDDPTVPAPPSPTNVFVAAGAEGAFESAGLTPGHYKFQCCIHPWMQVILTVK